MSAENGHVQGKYALVTGGAHGIGRAVCLQLAERGWHVAVADIDERGAGETAALADQAGGGGLAGRLDVASGESWQALHARLEKAWPRIDLLVNNAGCLAGGDVIAMDDDVIRRLIDVNLLGTIHGCRLIAPWLIRSASSRPAADGPRGIINIASIFAHVSPPGFAIYNATKAAIVALTESLHGELARHRVGATVVLPGVVGTRLFSAGVFSDARFAQLARDRAETATISPEEVARVALSASARGKLFAIVGRRARMYARLKRLCPAATIRAVAHQVRRELKQIGGRAEPRG